ncbi:MBL fold metallo-hydrolase [Acetonema longum]|uniref:Putative Zn-dependent hydrolase n=1 Tax=Acetonema longum DSM 6540 TaxID=1009370 RepID=F7NFY9_9FIRM|nr:MBL fold metallo-hydrolase [Acetonema longum]EGO65052.1 putative Zn-dependent hydrolase [Acetonema longum DSM 6540]
MRKLVESVATNLYRVEIPLPQSPLKTLNSYVVTGERNLVIDTGFNRPECQAAMTEGLASLGVDLDRTDLFITHMHADHTGLIGMLRRPASRIFCSKTDGDSINAFGTTEAPWQELAKAAGRNGFSSSEMAAGVEKHPGYLYRQTDWIGFSPVQDGDILSYGGYRFQCLATPGHTRGHMCLYEPAVKILLSGDHILGDITPNITAWQEGENSLTDYLASLDKVMALNIDTVLPAHQRAIGDWRARVDEIIRHHHDRLEEVRRILASGVYTGYQIASRMHWSLTYASWEEFPVQQKWFATGEAVAHLEYLAGRGEVSRVRDHGVIRYALQRSEKNTVNIPNL